MTREQFLLLVDDVFERRQGTLKGNEALDDLDWDSLKTLMFIAMVDESVGTSVALDALAECRTVNDLVDLVGDRVTR